MARGLTEPEDVQATLHRALAETSRRVAPAVAVATARVLNIPQRRRQQLPQLVDPATCPTRFLGELAATLGFTDDLRITARVEDEDWRRVLAFAADLWREKGLHEAIKDVLRAFGGARAWIGDWFSFRTVAGVSLLPFFGTGPIPEGGDLVVDVHVEDLDGLLDRARAMDALDVVRPAGETFRAVFVHYVENWDSLSRWPDRLNATLGDQELVLDASVGTARARETWAYANSYTDAWDHVTYNAILRLDAGTTVRLYIRDDSADWYRVDVAEGVAPNNVELRRTAALVAQGTHPVPPAPAAPILLSVSTLPKVGGALEIQVAIDGATAITYTDPAPWLPGDVWWQVPAVGGARVEWFEVLPGNAEVREVP